MNNLITKDLNEYENLAVEMAKNEFFYNEFKKKIKSVNTKKLFDSKKYTENLENLFTKILN